MWVLNHAPSLHFGKAPFHAVQAACSLHHNIKSVPWAQAVDRQTAPAKQDTASNDPFLNTREGPVCILQVANINDALGPQGDKTAAGTTRPIYSAWHLLSV